MRGCVKLHCFILEGKRRHLKAAWLHFALQALLVGRVSTAIKVHNMQIFMYELSNGTMVDLREQSLKERITSKYS